VVKDKHSSKVFNMIEIAKDVDNMVAGAFVGMEVSEPIFSHRTSVCCS
jgi:hypothetical protein